MKYLGTPFIFKMLYGPKTGAKTYFKTKALPRLCIYKTIGTWFYDPLFYKTTILEILVSGFQTPLRKTW
jgi:hypothetical protein